MRGVRLEVVVLSMSVSYQEIAAGVDSALAKGGNIFSIRVCPGQCNDIFPTQLDRAV
jgi:hypothetical protein